MTSKQISAEEISATFLAWGGPAVLAHLPEIGALGVAEIAALPPLPYGDDGFSRRLLREQTDLATTDSSRPPDLVDRQLTWLRAQLPDWYAGDVLHPLCGPGVWAEVLGAHGATSYLGIDAGPAVVAHARARLAGVPDRHFVLGDATDPAVLPPDQSFDTVLLSYDSFNFFTPLEVQPLLDALVRRLRPGGTLVLDLRLAEDGGAGFDEGRQVQSRPDGSVFRDGPHLLLSEGFIADGGGLVGHRIIALGTGADSSAPDVFHSVLNVPSLDGLTARLKATGLEVQVAGRPFPGTDDPNLRRHLVAARKQDSTPDRLLEKSR